MFRTGKVTKPRPPPSSPPPPCDCCCRRCGLIGGRVPYPGASVCPSRDAGPAGYAPLRGMSEGQRHSADHAPNGKGSPATSRAPTMPSCSTRSKKRQRPVVAGTTTICDDNGHGVHTSLQHQPTFHHRGGISTTIDSDVAWAHRFTVAGNGLKVPLAPMPSRCKRARRVRVPVDSTSATMSGDVGESGGCGPASSSSGSTVV